ncbi:uncharacterized protein H6S33_008487 [Morchella sextelata]|uniref:uncharacterized protein n=1 Tax=Morchella sextelata TaxID=1174677 RepID=UPI001D03E08E|nr:uncharacterized protein H6S33_008487 [Morchella sextelata]KAH0602837.1 hypothetical protein H6S33_008487 [Morchella sextelata]
MTSLSLNLLLATSCEATCSYSFETLFPSLIPSQHRDPRVALSKCTTTYRTRQYLVREKGTESRLALCPITTLIIK